MCPSTSLLPTTSFRWHSSIANRRECDSTLANVHVNQLALHAFDLYDITNRERYPLIGELLRRFLGE